ncbi:ATP-binding protein [Desertibacillus haloalkaliphilus]|uniref:ATP-binding protein n=1 Tax=Desertibacillus haloalkaliphilus TaxID=1328930 RepID=UPI001C274494|nr:sensor histidine kinase [Desertibacillus haloalkaliphilus]MBU8908920.1 sensor histidine kinase [Desertibacillus haloalkaliphilus]
MKPFQKKKLRIFNGLPAFRFTLLLKTIVLICSLLTIMLLFLGMYTNTKYSETLVEQIGNRALNVAHSVSEIPEVKEAFHTENPAEIIQPIVERIRVKTESEFIVVGNREGERYSHPYEERIGEVMVGDDNERALLRGESYVSEAEGSLGPSIRGKVPIFAHDGEIIGVVSVGFLIDDIEMTVGTYVSDVWYLIMICMFVGVVGATLISLHVKKSILGLEPEEIGRLFQEREAIFQSIREAIIAVDRNGYITMYNSNAGKVLQHKGRKVVGTHIKDLLPQTQLMEVLETGKSHYNQELWVNEERYVVNRIPIYYGQKLMGAVSTFRNRTEIESLAEELSKVKQYSEALRVQTHEFSNKLNTISGFLQLDQIEEAIDFINKESRQQQEWIHFLIRNVRDPYVSAALLGKLNRAHELGITMTINANSELHSPLTEKQREGLVTILGNLLENAYEAVKESTQQLVTIFFTDIGHELIFEIEDSGVGIPEESVENVFTKGYSTKEGAHRGIGLALVQQQLEQLDGYVTLETSDLGGACFIIAIPKDKK